MYHCAVAVRMMFNAPTYGSSGAESRQSNNGLNYACAENAMRTYFRLEPDTLYGTGTTCTVRGLSNDTTKGAVLGGGVYNYRDTVYLQASPAPM